MNKLFLTWGLVNFSLMLFGLTPAMAITGSEVMKMNEERRQIDEVRSSATLMTGGGGSPERIKKFTWWRKLESDRVHFNTLTRFHSPAEIRGEGILFLEHSGDHNEVLMYLPNFKKIRRVESQQQSGSFMGSELSYSDIATPHFDDYQQNLSREEALSGNPCYVVESVPKTDEVKERTGYSKVVSWVRKDNFMVIRADHFGLDGQLLKTLDASEIRRVDDARNKWMAHKVRVENTKTKRFTVLQFSDVQVNQGIPDSTFTQQNLARVQ